MLRTTLLLLCALLLVGGCGDVVPAIPAPDDDDDGIDPNRTVGVLQNDAGTAAGYVLFAPMSGMVTWLIDNEGGVVNSWQSAHRPGNSVYLLDDGSLLRTGRAGTVVNPTFTAGGAGGRVQRFTWDGTLVWDYLHSGANFLHHHDIAPLPNGNVLLIAWEGKTPAEAAQAGRDPATLSDGALWPDYIVEIEPSGLTGGNVVWEWHAWDHLIQDFDMNVDNFGVVADHPERIDVNFRSDDRADWMHSNAIDYNAAFDQVLLAVHHFGEIWVLDHGTTTAEAAGTTGGRQGMGGDILYRWGNPAAYDHGTAGDQQLFGAHNATWIGDGDSNMLVFNNGSGRPAGMFSSVDEIVPPADLTGAYTRMMGVPFGPLAPTAIYTAPVPTDFFASFISGAQRLSGGNTLICEGPVGRFFEVTSGGTKVWEYVNPDIGTGVPLNFDDPVPAGGNGLRNLTFRATRIPPGHPGLLGKDLTPGATIETN